MENTIDTFNEFFVGLRGDEIVICNPPRQPMSKERALRLAAWIVACADNGEFDGILKAVCDT